MKAIQHTKIINTPLRNTNKIITTRIFTNEVLRATFTDPEERITEYVKARTKERNNATIDTKRTRPVFVPRENPDTPPMITAHVKELASLIRNTNSITAHEHSDLWKLDARINQPYEIKPRYRPLWVCMSAPVKGKEHGRWYTEYGNIQPEDKPAFRHDSLFLFDTLSEDYCA